MNRKEHKRHMAYEALILLGMLALLTFICRLWPILLLIILGIFVAVIRLLFLSSKTVEPIEVQTTVQEPTPIPTEKDVRDLAYGVIQRRVTELVLAEFPQARWIWENPNARKSIESGESVYILLNRAGGYRRAKVEVQNLQIVGIQFCTAEGHVLKMNLKKIWNLQKTMMRDLLMKPVMIPPVKKSLKTMNC